MILKGIFKKIKPCPKVAGVDDCSGHILNRTGISTICSGEIHSTRENLNIPWNSRRREDH